MPCISGRTAQQIRYQRHLQDFIQGRLCTGAPYRVLMTDVTYLALMYSVGFSREECQRELEKAIDLRERFRKGEQLEFGAL